MTEKIDLVIANPTGNITIMVVSPIPRERYQEVAGKLLLLDFGEYCQWVKPDEHGRKSCKGEQVAFILSDDGTIPAMEMCGLEFCGNASRSFAYYRYKMFGDGTHPAVSVSGTNKALNACIYPVSDSTDANQDKCKDEAQIEMPLPLSIKTLDEASMERCGRIATEDLEIPDETDPIIVDFEGIAHLVMHKVEPTEETFIKIRDYVCTNIYPTTEAFGIMFIDENSFMTPVVYVRDVDTIYFEGSCASGTTAAGCAKAIHEPDSASSHSYTFNQPNGSLSVIVKKQDNIITDLILNGTIEMTDIITINI